MRRPILILWVLLTVGATAAQDRTPAADTLAAAAIAGRVITSDTGSPIRGAQVRLRSVTGGDTRLAITDDQGQFEARNLFAGGWQIAVAKSGFVTTRYGQRRSSDEGKPVTVTGTQRATILVAMQRAGAITGRVVDEFGEPLLGARIQALATRIVRGSRQTVAVGASATTDDTGAFRVFGLSPGTYFISAMLRASTPDTDFVQGTLGALTYYPGTADVGEAQAIVLRAGDEPNIAFQVAPVRSVRISGVVLGGTGAPAADADVHLRRLDASDVGTTVGNFGRSGADGSFTIINVPPGPYVLTASRMLPIPKTRTLPENVRPFEEAVTPIAVGGEDIAGITLAMGTGVTIKGTIVGDNGSTLPSPLRLEVSALPAFGFGRNPAVIQVTRNTQSPAFEIPGLLGPVSLGVNVPDGLMLRAIEANGVDVTDRFIELRGAAPEIRIVLSTQVTEVSGLVTRGGAPVNDASVLIFPDNEAKWNFPSRFVAMMDVDQGRYVVRRLPPGERYFAAVVPPLEDGEQFNPELLRDLRNRATPFTLRDGEHLVVNLTAGR